MLPAQIQVVLYLCATIRWSMSDRNCATAFLIHVALYVMPSGGATFSVATEAKQPTNLSLSIPLGAHGHRACTVLSPRTIIQIAST